MRAFVKQKDHSALSAQLHASRQVVSGGCRKRCMLCSNSTMHWLPAGSSPVA